MVAPYDEINHCQSDGDEKPHNKMMQSPAEAETGNSIDMKCYIMPDRFSTKTFDRSGVGQVRRLIRHLPYFTGLHKLKD